MIFSDNKAIYLQIADRICDEILSEQYHDNDRIPSIREYSVMLGVNTATAVKAYEELARSGIIYNKRGLGYFVSEGAKRQILDERRTDFRKNKLPEMFRQMALLDIDISEIDELWLKRN